MEQEKTINVRIKQLEDERAQLVTAHDSAMAQFQQLILNNRNRFQQLSGAIDELQKLTENPNQERNTHHDNIPIIADLGHRLAHVRTGVQSEDS